MEDSSGKKAKVMAERKLRTRTPGGSSEPSTEREASERTSSWEIRVSRRPKSIPPPTDEIDSDWGEPEATTVEVPAVVAKAMRSIPPPTDEIDDAWGDTDAPVAESIQATAEPARPASSVRTPTSSARAPSAAAAADAPAKAQVPVGTPADEPAKPTPPPAREPTVERPEPEAPADDATIATSAPAASDTVSAPPTLQSTSEHEAPVIVREAPERPQPLEPTQKRADPGARSRVRWLAAAAGLVVVAVAWTVMRPSAQPTPTLTEERAPRAPAGPPKGQVVPPVVATPPASRPEAPSKPAVGTAATRTVLVRARPKGSEILIGTKVVGTTTAEISVEDGEKVRLLVRRKGHSSRRLSVDGSEGTVVVQLVRKTGRDQAEPAATESTTEAPTTAAPPAPSPPDPAPEPAAPAPAPVSPDTPYGAAGE